MIVNRYGYNVTQKAYDIEEIVEAARAGGKPLANKVYSAIVKARSLTRAEAVMLSGMAQARCTMEGVILWRTK